LAKWTGLGKLPATMFMMARGPVAKMASEGVHFYHYDGLGSTIAMTDANSNLLWIATEIAKGIAVYVRGLDIIIENTHQIVQEKTRISLWILILSALF
jgi:hypothetical protein